jgi:hypothetical protein
VKHILSLAASQAVWHKSLDNQAGAWMPHVSEVGERLALTETFLHSGTTKGAKVDTAAYLCPLLMELWKLFVTAASPFATVLFHQSCKRIQTIVQRGLQNHAAKEEAGIAHLLQFQDLIGLVQDLGSKRQQQQLRPPDLHMQSRV